MKKMMMVLMMVFGLSAVFAKPVVSDAYIGGSKYVFVADDEVKLPKSHFKGLTDNEIVELVKSCTSEKVGERYALYVGYLFNDATELVKKYNNYHLFSEDGDSMFIDQDLMDGRMVRLVYLLREDKITGNVELD